MRHHQSIIVPSVVAGELSCRRLRICHLSHRAKPDLEEVTMDTFDKFGNYRHQVHSLFHDSDPKSIADEVDYAAFNTLLVHKLVKFSFIDVFARYLDG